MLESEPEIRRFLNHLRIVTDSSTQVARLFQQVFVKYDELNLSVQENITGIRLVKAFVREDYEEKKFKNISNTIYTDFVKAEKNIAFMNPLMMTCIFTCTLIIAWLGAHEIVKSGNDIASVFLQPVRIKTYQEGRIRALGHLRAAAGFDHLCIMLQDFPVHLHFIGPTAVEMGQIILVRIQIQGTGSVVEQLYGFLAGIPDFRMGTDDILFLVGVIDKPHFQEGNRILQEDLRRDDIPVRDNLMVCVDQFRVVVSIGILHMEGGFAEVAAARRGIGHGSFPVVRPPTCPVRGKGRWISDLRAEMDRLEDAVLLRDEDELRVFRLHRDDGFPGRRGRNGQGDSQQA